MGGKPQLRYKGVVFNEMKGVYSSPDSLHHIAVQEALFPSTAYRHSSGGDPAAIPHLTFQQFQVRSAHHLRACFCAS